MISPRIALALVILLCVLSAAVARAQEKHRGDPPGYTEAINQALLELEANNLPEAGEEFRRAHAIFPNARTLRGMGMVEFELRNYGESVSLLEQALASPTKPLEGKLRAETETLLERARRYLGEVAIKLAPRNATLSVDGVKARLSDGVLRLEVGQHVLEAQAPGYASERRELRVSGGTRSEITLSLRALEAPPELGENQPQPFNTSEQPRSERQPAYKKWWVWTIVAVAVAGGATAAALLLTRDREKQDGAVRSANTPDVALYTLGRR